MLSPCPPKRGIRPLLPAARVERLEADGQAGPRVESPSCLKADLRLHAGLQCHAGAAGERIPERKVKEPSC